MRRLLRWLGYPLVTVGAVALCALLLRYGWPSWAIAGVATGLACAAAEVLERVIPYSAAWSRSRGDLPTDIAHFAFTNRFIDVGGAMAIAVFTPLGVALMRALGVRSLWPDAWPLAAQVALGLALVELPSYWVHRIEHTHPLVWRIHAVHHSGERMYWWNFSRQHPLDNLVTALLSVAPLALLGVSEPVVAFMLSFAGAHGMLQHCNADLRTGPLDLLLATPRVHRWHHSRKAEESMANYGGVLTIWDHVFRSRRFPADVPPPEEVGLYPRAAPFPTDYLGQLKSPFVASLWKG
jgi:sterol desaturase/sphingolipid hydroxylase (fatty acid hydroxylase superfamily)